MFVKKSVKKFKLDSARGPNLILTRILNSCCASLTEQVIIDKLTLIDQKLKMIPPPISRAIFRIKLKLFALK